MRSLRDTWGPRAVTLPVGGVSSQPTLRWGREDEITCWQASWHLVWGVPQREWHGVGRAARISFSLGTASLDCSRPPEREALACGAHPLRALLRSPALGEAPQSCAGGRISSTDSTEPCFLVWRPGLSSAWDRQVWRWVFLKGKEAQTGAERPGSQGLGLCVWFIPWMLEAQVPQMPGPRAEGASQRESLIQL